MERKYIVEFEKGVFLAPWKGDPGRTLIESSAKQFDYKIAAQRALLKSKKDNPHRKWSGSCVRLQNAL
jgi:hypothetical protein